MVAFQDMDAKRPIIRLRPNFTVMVKDARARIEQRG
jgi:hypothetical protein